jgi:hypothetical protein
MTKVWTGKELKEGASVAEIEAGLAHLQVELQTLASQIRPDLPTSDASKLLEKIDQYIAAYNVNAAALNEHEVRVALTERAAIIAGIAKRQ